MSRGTNKSVQTTRDPAVLAAFEALSKAAIFDLAVDLIRQVEGDELLDGGPLRAALVEAYEPIRVLRRDLPIPLPRSRNGRIAQLDRAAILDVVEVLTRTDEGISEALVESTVLYGRLRTLGWTDARGRHDLRTLRAEGLLELVHDRDGIAYRLTASERARRAARRHA